MKRPLHPPTRLQTEADGVDAAQLPLDALQPGHRLGAYRLVRLLGSGGMGQVWLAEQQQPFQRTVALKLQRERLAGGAAEAYFQIERQALAQLLHPYVAQIYDAGSLPDGSLYFAMEYVDGLRLDEWLQRRRPNLTQLIDLLIKLCQGVQHAHQRGLLHRDLKPANVLVVEVAGQPLPKIIDFGVAIGLDPRSGVAVGSRRAGTRAWMAPEQLNPDDAGIDARVDVFALGLLLALSMCRVLGVDEPEAGSQYLETLFGRSTELARRTAPTNEVSRATAAMDMAARRSIPPELRAIAGRAIAHDREARYDSASALADDLQRWRDHLPVRAMGGGRWYAAQCFVRRNRLATIAATLIALALVAGSVAAWLGMREADRQRAIAEQRRDRAEQLIGFMLGDFSEKLRLLGRLDLLDSVSEQAMRYLGDPAVTGDSLNSVLYRARSLRTLGEVQSGRGQTEAAAQVFNEAWELVRAVDAPAGGHPELLFEQAQLAYWLGNLAYQRRDLELTETHWLRYQQLAEQLVPLTATTGQGLLESSYAFSNLGTLAFERSDFAKAATRFEQALRLKQDYLKEFPGDASAIDSLSDSTSWLGRTYESQGRLADAFTLYQRQLKTIQDVRATRPEEGALRYSEAIAHFWLGLAALNIGQQDAALEHVSTAESMLQALVAFDATQVKWQRYLLSASVEILYIRLMASPASADESSFVALQQQLRALEISAADDSQLRRDKVRLDRYQILTSSGDDWGVLDRVEKTLAGHSAEPDRRLLLLVRLDVARKSTGARRAALLQSVRAILRPLPLRAGEFRELDAWARLLTLQGELQQAAEAERLLDDTGYRHPDYLRFLSTAKGE